MTTSSEKPTGHEDSAAPRARLSIQLAVELVIGLGLVLILVMVAWASSNAIRFVYGGY